MNFLTKHQADDATRWALNGKWLPADFDLKKLLSLSAQEIDQSLTTVQTAGEATGEQLAPIEPDHEVWASGVTYSRSRDAREAETEVKSVYDRVYDAERPELFFKAIGWRVRGSGSPIRIRRDSEWNVPEPELTLVINCGGEIVGYCAGNDVSSRSIEGENPLYLPQAKMYDGSCALGPGILITGPEMLRDLPIRLIIKRAGETVFEGGIRSSGMKRSPEALVSYLVREMTFPYGVFLLTGTGIVPAETFTLQVGDRVIIEIGSLTLENPVEG
jgi:2-dehydro-3-deoxy-D-arabinonate dehydratase